VQNTIYVYRQLHQPGEALAYLDSLGGVAKEAPEFKADRAWFLAQDRKSKEAIELYASLFDGDFVNDEQFVVYAGLLADSGEVKRAVEAAGNYVKKRNTISARISYSSLLIRDGRAKDAVATLTEGLERFPNDPELGFSLVEAQLGAELFTGALGTLDSLTKRGFKTAYAQTLTGRAQMGLKHYREARENFQAAARLDPQNPRITTYLDLVNGLLGQGNNHSITAEIEPVSIPKQFLDGKRQVVPESSAKKAGAYYTTCCTGIFYKKGERRKITTTYVAKMMDESGCSAFSSFQFAFNPLMETIYVNDLTVRDENGKVIATGNRDQYYVIDGGEANSRRGLNIPVPGLRPGATISITVTTQDLANSEHPLFWHTYLSRSMPVAESVVYLTGDLAAIHVDAPAEVKDEVVAGGVAYTIANPTAMRLEPMQSNFDRFIPTFAMGPNNGAWKEIVTNYLARIKSKLPGDERTHALAASACKGLTNDLAKIRALTRVAQTKVRYVAIEFGTRGQIPASPAETLDNGFGDCKDGSVLLKALLEDAGIPAKLALLNPHRRIFKEMPSMDQFTHAIVYVPSLGIFLDPADKFLDLASMPPLELLRCEALIVDPEKPEFVTIQPSGAGVTGLKIRREITLTSSNAVEVAETLNLAGYAAEGFRGMLTPLQPGDRRIEIEKALNRRAGAMDLKDLEIVNLEEVTLPLILKSKYSLARRSESFKIPTLFEAFYLTLEPSPERRNPFDRRAPIEIQCATNVKLPEGFLAEANLSQPLRTAFGDANISAKQDHGSLAVTASAHLAPGERSAADYSNCMRFLADVSELFQAPIQLRKSGQ